MAIVGEAHILVRAITTGVARDIKNGFDGISGNFARAAGNRMANSFTRGWNQAKGANVFTRLTEGLRTLSPAAEVTADKFRMLVRAGFALGPIISVLVGGIGSLVASLGTLVAAVAAAIPALFSLVNIFGSLAIGARVFSFGVKGIGQAVSKATKSTSALGKSVAELREEFQQLGFDAEDAALSEERAGLNLEKARENLMRMADLPPNSAARREAELTLKEAELAYRRAKDRTQDLNEELAKGPEALQDAAGADPYADLTKSQKIFAQFLAKEIVPGIKELREIVAANLLLPLIEDIRLLNQTLFPVLEDKLAMLATTIEGELSEIIAKIVEPETIGEIETAFDNVNSTLSMFGELIAAGLDGFLSLFNAAQPVAERFVASIITKLEQFATWSDTEAGKNRLAEIFQLASDVAASFGRIAGNIISGIGNLIQANFGDENGAGFTLLKWFEDATASFATLGSENPDAFAQYFKDALTNTQAIFSSFGELFKGIFSVADNPAIAETFKQLEAGVPALTSIIEKNIEAGPALAEFITTILEIIDVLTDTEAIKVFFNTLTAISEVVRDFFNNELVQKILAVTGPILAFALAIGTAMKVAKFFGSAFNGIIQGITGPIGDLVTKGRTAFTGLATSTNPFKVALGKLGTFMLSSPVLIGIALLVAGFIYLYNTSDEFRAFVDTTLKGVLESLGESFGRVMEALQPLIDMFTGELLPTLIDVLQPILEIIIIAVGSLAVFLGQVLAAAVETIVPLIMTLFEILNPLLDIFAALIELVVEFAKALMTGDWAAFGEIFKDVLRDVLQGVLDLANNVANLFIDLINGVIAGFFNGFGGGIADLIKVFSKGEIDLKANPPRIPRFPEFAQIPSFALGGTIFPSAGGSIVRVAEAGRPERIEPLDPQGLSARDRAIIDRLSTERPGINMNIYASPEMDVKELASEVERRLAFSLVRGRVSI